MKLLKRIPSLMRRGGRRPGWCVFEIHSTSKTTTPWSPPQRGGENSCYTFPMKGKQLWSTIAVLAILAVIALLFTFLGPRKPVPRPRPVSNFEECIAGGNPIMESYPRQCMTPDGRNFTEEIPPQEEPENGLGLQANGCAVAGCSGQLCVSADEAGNIVTTCEFRAEYACYREASCEPQPNGQCGWTQTPELTTCLSNPPSLE